MRSILCILGLHKHRPIKSSIRKVDFDKDSRDTYVIAMFICVREFCAHEHEMEVKGYDADLTLARMAVKK